MHPAPHPAPSHGPSHAPKLEPHTLFQKEVLKRFKSLPPLREIKDKGILLELIDTGLDALIEEARVDFFCFIKVMAPTILPDTFINGRHIKIICKELMKMESSIRNKDLKHTRLCVSLPPGSMKTILQNLYTAWVMGRNPHWHILAIGSDTKFAWDKFGRAVKRVMESAEYGVIFPGISVRQDSNSAGRWITNKNGEYFCTGVGSNIVGRRANLAICLLNSNLVKTKDRGFIRLEDLKRGDFIKGPKGFEKVTNTLVHRHKLIYNINQQVESSPDHPFKVKGKGWVEAQKVEIGDKLEVESLWHKIKRLPFPRNLRTLLGEQC